MNPRLNFKPHLAAVLAVSLLTFTPAHAEHPPEGPPEMIGVRFIELAPGTHHLFKNWLGEQVFPALREGGAQASWVWDFVTGPADTVVIAHPLKDFAAWDEPGPLERVREPEQLRAMFSQVTPWVQSHRYEIARPRPDLSTREAPPRNIMVACGVTIRPGHSEAFEKMIVEDYHPVVREAGVPFAVSQTIFGSSAHYVLFHDETNFASLDLGPPARRVLDEERRAALNRKLDEHVSSIECNVVRYDAETSFEVEAE